MNECESWNDVGDGDDDALLLDELVLVGPLVCLFLKDNLANPLCNDDALNDEWWVFGDDKAGGVGGGLDCSEDCRGNVWERCWRD